MSEKDVLAFRELEDEDSGEADSEMVDTSRQRRVVDTSYKNGAYWQLPENVRNAIDLAKMKSQHSEFYYRLQTLNDKILVFRSIFYNKMPSYQRAFLQKKQQELEFTLQEQKKLFEAQMQSIEARINRKMKSSDTVTFKFGQAGGSPLRSSSEKGEGGPGNLSEKKKSKRLSPSRGERHARVPKFGQLELTQLRQEQTRAKIGRKSTMAANNNQKDQKELSNRADGKLSCSLPIAKAAANPIAGSVEGSAAEEDNSYDGASRDVNSNCKASSLGQIQEAVAEQDDEQSERESKDIANGRPARKTKTI